MVESHVAPREDTDLELREGPIKVEDGVSLLDELAFFLAGRQDHGLRG